MYDSVNGIAHDLPGAEVRLMTTGHLTTDAVLASSVEVMQCTMDYMNRKYGSAAGYVKSIGLTNSEVSHIRLNLMQEAAPKDLLSRLAYL